MRYIAPAMQIEERRLGADIPPRQRAPMEHGPYLPGQWLSRLHHPPVLGDVGLREKGWMELVVGLADRVGLTRQPVVVEKHMVDRDKPAVPILGEEIGLRQGVEKPHQRPPLRALREELFLKLHPSFSPDGQIVLRRNWPLQDAEAFP
jgi:hypothetical protein